jgi:predicted aldo/keto reductase-like oxidoreductase
MELLVEAKEQGKTRFLGLTSHGLQAPAVELEALKRFDFDTVMFPLNPRLWADPVYRADAETLLAVCQQKDVGVMAIKAAAWRPWQATTNEPRAPWYEPYHDDENIEKGVRWTLSQPGVTCAATVGNLAEMPLFLKAAANFAPMSRADQEALVTQRAAEVDETIFVGTAFNVPH